MERRRGHPQLAALERLPGKRSLSILKVGGRAKAEAKLSVRETVRSITRRSSFFRVPWDLWRGAMGTVSGKTREG